MNVKTISHQWLLLIYIFNNETVFRANLFQLSGQNPPASKSKKELEEATCLGKPPSLTPARREQKRGVSILWPHV